MRKLLAGLAMVTAVGLFAADGKAAYSKCISCHGVNGERVALGKSKIIKDMSVEEITKALQGYKDGTYGGVMKGIMKGQVSALSKEDIDAISEHIGKK